MKKTLAAAAVLCAFAGSAMADVTVYGRIDTGLLYTDDGDTKTLEMANGQTTGGRWGLKGATAVSETTKVGFVLESRVYGDTGAMPSNNKMFDREATVYAAGPMGTVYAGRINSFWSDGGSVAMWSNYAAFGTGTNVGYGTGMMVGHSRTDNTVAYVSPAFGGMKLYAEYAMGNDKVENTSEAARHMGFGLEYKAGAFGLAAAVMFDNEQSWMPEAKNAAGETVPAHAEEQEDQMTLNLAASYDFGCAKVFLAGQYYQGADKVGKFDKVGVKGEDLEGYALDLGAKVPMAGGVWTVGATYAEGENKVTKAEYEGYNVAAQYVYSFSKQVQVYGGVGYLNLEAGDKEYDATMAMAGMVVRF